MHPALIIGLFATVCAVVAAAISAVMCKMYRSIGTNIVVLASSAPIPILLLGLAAFQAIWMAVFPDQAYALEIDSIAITHRVYGGLIAAAFALIVGGAVSAFLTRRFRANGSFPPKIGRSQPFKGPQTDRH